MLDDFVFPDDAVTVEVVDAVVVLAVDDATALLTNEVSSTNDCDMDGEPMEEADESVGDETEVEAADEVAVVMDDLCWCCELFWVVFLGRNDF